MSVKRSANELITVVCQVTGQDLPECKHERCVGCCPDCKGAE